MPSGTDKILDRIVDCGALMDLLVDELSDGSSGFNIDVLPNLLPVRDRVLLLNA